MISRINISTYISYYVEKIITFELISCCAVTSGVIIQHTAAVKTKRECMNLHPSQTYPVRRDKLFLYPRNLLWKTNLINKIDHIWKAVQWYVNALALSAFLTESHAARNVVSIDVCVSQDTRYKMVLLPFHVYNIYPSPYLNWVSL